MGSTESKILHTPPYHVKQSYTGSGLALEKVTNAALDSDGNFHFPPNITHVAGLAFSNTNTTCLSFPMHIQLLDSSACADAEELLEVTFEQGSVSIISSFAFSKCSKLMFVNFLNWLVEISEFAFAWCPELLKLDLPDTLTKLGRYAFCECKKLERIVIPGSIKIIPEGVLEGCASLSIVVLSHGVRSIQQYAFRHCEKLRAIILPTSIQFISPHAFDSCHCLNMLCVNSNDKEEIQRVQRLLPKHLQHLVISRAEYDKLQDGQIAEKDRRHEFDYPRKLSF